MRIEYNLLLRNLSVGIAVLLCAGGQLGAQEYNYKYADTLMVLGFSSSLYDTNYGLYVSDKNGRVKKYMNIRFQKENVVPPQRGDEIVAKLDSVQGHMVVYRNLTAEKMCEYFVKKKAMKYK